MWGKKLAQRPWVEGLGLWGKAHYNLLFGDGWSGRTRGLLDSLAKVDKNDQEQQIEN